MNQIATIDQTTAVAIRKPQEVRVVSDPIAVLDTARFEHMQRIATVMAHSNLIPDTLCFEKNQAGDLVALPMETVTANCFLVVNQAVRWNMDPFAVAQCVSVVHGKLCYEGKLIAAVLEGKLGVELEYEITGLGDAMKVVVSGAVNGKPVVDSKGRTKEIDGTVGDWKTTGRGSPWDARGGHKRMLRYRGAREWGRVYAPGLMLGVYSDDEMEDLSANHRAQQARVVNDEPPAPPAAQIEQKTMPSEISHPDKGVSEDAERAELSREAVTDEQVAETGRHDPSTVEWSEPETEQQAADEQPPVPPQTEVKGAEPPKPDLISTGKIESDFPGDKPMTPSEQVSASNGGIPDFLKRQGDTKQGEPEPVLDVEAALKALGEALTGVESTDDLAEVQTKYQQPLKGKVSKADWARSQTLVMEAFQRISEAE